MKCQKCGDEITPVEMTLVGMRGIDGVEYIELLAECVNDECRTDHFAFVRADSFLVDE